MRETDDKQAGVRRWGAAVAVGTAYAFFAGRLFLFIDRYAVNVLFWDQWDFLAGLREGASPWQLFSWIHGPHRMGLGYLFIAAVYRLSGWNDRTLAFAIGGVLVAASIGALLLKRRISGRLSILDMCIPALILTTAQFEAFIGTLNPAHGPLPLLMVVLAPFLWLIGYGPLRALLGGALAFCAAYTGFALFLAPCLAALFLLDALTSQPRAWNAAGAVLSLTGLGSFFIGYRFSPFVDCFVFPHARPLEYVPFAGLTVMRALRLVHMVRIAPLLAVLGALLAAATAAWGAVTVAQRRSLLNRTVFIFSTFSLLFIANSAVGRVCQGMQAALASRYVPYVVPLWLAAYFAIDAGTSWALRWSARALVAAVMFVQIFVHDDTGTIRSYSEGKSSWRACFLATPDEDACNQATNFRIYPVAHAPQVEQMLDFLRRNRLNIYLP
jgi:hypothetical protein